MLMHTHVSEGSPSRFDVLQSQTRRLQLQFVRLQAVVQQLNEGTVTSQQLRAEAAERRAGRAGQTVNGNDLQVAPGADVLPARKLTRRMRQILPLLMQGLSEKEVAVRLGCSPHTVHIHVTRMYARLGVHSRAELLALSYQSRGAAAPVSEEV